MRSYVAIGLLTNVLISLLASSLLVSAQEDIQLLRIEDSILFTFRPNGKVQSQVKEKVTYNLPKKFALILDDELAGRMNFRQLKKLQDIAQEITSKIAEFSRDVSNNPKDKSKILDRWKEYLKQTNARFDANLSASEFHKIRCQLEVDSFLEDFNKDIQKLADETIEKLPPGVKEQVLVNDLMVTYQRFGIEQAFFSKSARDRLELSLDSNDKSKVRGKANQARKLLEQRVQELLSGLFKEQLSQYFSPEDISLRWLDQQKNYQIPPVELMPSWFEEE